MGTPEELIRKKELILQNELVFANQIGSAVFEKPRVNFWMVLIPILFLYFIYRMQKYKQGRMKFDADFMITRRRAMEVAVEALKTDTAPDFDRVVRESSLVDDALRVPYGSWAKVLTEHYMDLLAADGDTYEALVRSAFHSSMNYLLALNRISTAERQFYSAIKPRLSETEGAAAIIATIEERSQQLRRDMTTQIFG
ncbi:MAG: NF038143 family protein [Syntrophobacteraceae bacterium]